MLADMPLGSAKQRAAATMAVTWESLGTEELMGRMALVPMGCMFETLANIVKKIQAQKHTDKK